MSDTPTLEKPQRRRYDQPARLSPEETAGEINRLTSASLRLATQLRNSKLARAEPAHAVRATVTRVVTDLDELRERLNALLLAGAVDRRVPLAGSGPRMVGGQADPKAPAQPDGGIVAQMASRGELLESADFADRMGWTRQALSKAQRVNRVFYVELRGVRMYPAFFADAMTYERAQLQQVSKELGTLPGGAKLQFFLSRRGSLGGASVLQALAKGQVGQVVAAAQAYAHG